MNILKNNVKILKVNDRRYASQNSCNNILLTSFVFLACPLTLMSGVVFSFSSSKAASTENPPILLKVFGPNW